MSKREKVFAAAAVALLSGAALLGVADDVKMATPGALGGALVVIAVCLGISALEMKE